jgi:hypothetical protein
MTLLKLLLVAVLLGAAVTFFGKKGPPQGSYEQIVNSRTPGWTDWQIGVFCGGQAQRFADRLERLDEFNRCKKWYEGNNPWR